MTSDLISSQPRALATLLAALCFSAFTLHAFSETPEHSTTIPITFTDTLKAGKTNAGTAFTAKTLQPIRLADNSIAPKGSTVEGHVLESRELIPVTAFDTAQKASILALHVDSITVDGKKRPLSVSLRAMANVIESVEASNPHYLDDTEPTEFRVLIGGDHFSQFDKWIYSTDAEIVGYTRKKEIYTRLSANNYNNGRAVLHCDETSTAQPVAIFSGSACGLYGFQSLYLSANGTNPNGSITLESKRETVELHSGATALLELAGQ